MKEAPAQVASEETELPEGWITARLSDLCEINPPKPKRDALPSDAAVTFVPMPAVDAEQGAIVNGSMRPFSQVSKGFTAFRDGDVIMAKITPCMENGKAAIARGLSNGLGFGSTEFHVFRPSGGILAEYLFYFIRQNSFRGEAEAEMTGSVGQKRVPVEFMRDVEVPLPPLTEQKRIVAKAEELLAHVNAARERLTCVAAILKRFRQSVLTAACENGDEVELVDLLTDLKYGTANKCEREPKGVPVLRIPNVRAGRIDHADLKYATLERRERDALALLPGDILMIRSNGSASLLGKTALVSNREAGFAYAGYLMRLRVDATKMDPRFLNLVLSGHDCRDQIEMPARSTSGVHNINSEEVRRLRVRVPSLPEQRDSLRRVETFFALADAIEAKVAAATALANALTQSILAKAFRGELVETEAFLARREDRAYEPASVLLERIRQQRATGEETPSRNRRSRRKRMAL